MARVRVRLHWKMAFTITFVLVAVMGTFMVDEYLREKEMMLDDLFLKHRRLSEIIATRVLVARSGGTISPRAIQSIDEYLNGRADNRFFRKGQNTSGVQLPGKFQPLIPRSPERGVNQQIVTRSPLAHSSLNVKQNGHNRAASPEKEVPPNHNLTYKFFVLDHSGKVTASNVPSTFGHRRSHPSVTAVLLGEKRFSRGTMKHDGNNFFVTTLVLPSLDEERAVDGAIHLAWPLDSVDKQLRGLLNRNLKDMGIITLVLIALMTLITRRFVARPVSELAAKMERVQRGDLTVSAEIHSRDEIGDLAVAFNKMVGDLAASHETLKQRNAEIQQFNESLADQVREQTQELRKSGEKYRALFEEARDAIEIVDVEGRILGCNRQSCDLIGYTREEMVGNCIHDFILPEIREGVIPRIRAIIDHGVLPFESVRVKKDGTTVNVEISATAINLEDQYHIIYFVRDISERKRAQEALRLSKEEAEGANRAKSEFLATMSHEIRTPMNGIIGMTGLLLDTELTGKQREFAKTVRDSGNALLTIINDILDFSKIEAGKLELEVIDFDLRQEVESVTELLVEVAHDKGLELDLLLPHDIPTALQGDPGRLRQILMNLMGNAIKFTEIGEVALRAKVERESDQSVQVRFKISDTGIGIPPEARERLFQPFSQADGSTTRKFGGTGLGLSICKQLIEKMGGEIGVESEPGEGSTFWFTARFDKQPQGAQKPALPRSDLNNLRVLVMDDDEVIRILLKEFLASWGMVATVARSASEALEKLRKGQAQGTPFDLLILDRKMPDADGLALARTIKADPSIASVHLVMLSGFEQSEEALQTGLSAYLVKPVTQSRLYNCIVTVMGGFPETKPVGTQALDGPMTNGKSKGRILVAEDNAANQKVIRHTLEKLGYRADLASNGKEAVEMWSKFPYQSILMDCAMPEMDGFEATAEIRRQEQEGQAACNIPIIALTANAMKEDRERCLAAGMDDYLSKPFKRDELSAILERWGTVSPSPSTAGSNGNSPDQAHPETLAEAPVNEETMEDLRETMGDEFGQYIQLFLKQSLEQIEALRTAITQGDAGTLTEIAHSLKNSWGFLGAERMSHICRVLETLGSTGATRGGDILAGKLEEEYAKIRTRLENQNKTVFSH